MARGISVPEWMGCLIQGGQGCPALADNGMGTSDSSTSVHISSTKELIDAIELTWHRHLELRNELYELEMGPSDILEMRMEVGQILDPFCQAFFDPIWEPIARAH
eukprot:scaffold73122_cov61-Cyclotella_meneghiniana.AAC.1